MKKSIGIIFLFISTFSFSQEFATPDTEWVYNVRVFGGHGINKISYEKDTLFNFKTWRKFQRELLTVSRFSNDTLTVQHPIFFHVEKGLVLVSEDLISLDTLHQLNAPPATQWKISLSWTSDIEVEIVDTFKIEIENQILKAQSVSYYYNEWETTIVDTVMEHIGNKNLYMLPWDWVERASDGGEGGEMRCFKNEKLGLLLNFPDLTNSWEFDFDCGNLSNNQIINSELKTIKIYPNPFINSLNIENNFNPQTVYLYDVMGNQILNQKIHFWKNTIDTHQLNAGVYFLKIGSETFKFIKQ